MRVIIKPMGLVAIGCIVVVSIGIQWAVFSHRGIASPIASKPSPVITAKVPAAPLREPKNLLSNGSMTDIDHDFPANWGGVWVSHGKLKISRDQTTFHTSPAALRVEGDHGPVIGQTANILPGHPGQRISVKGWLKSDFQGLVRFAVTPYDKSWKVNDMMDVGTTKTAIDWSLFRQTITLPKGTEHFAVVLFVDGKGRAWLDDVTVIEE